MNSRSIYDVLNNLIVKSICEEGNVPLASVGVPEFIYSTGKWCRCDREEEMIMDGVPNVTPWGGPNRVVASMELKLHTV
jgi:hypothetical protein